MLGTIVRRQDSRKHFGFLGQRLTEHILNRIGPFFAKETVAEDPVSPELRPSLCLYR